jgi:hypothetical protein
VCGKKGDDGCIPLIGHCNSPLNNKNSDYHCPVVFPILGFHINHRVSCVIVAVYGLFLVLFPFPLKYCYIYASAA